MLFVTCYIAVAGTEYIAPISPVKHFIFNKQMANN